MRKVLVKIVMVVLFFWSVGVFLLTSNETNARIESRPSAWQVLDHAYVAHDNRLLTRYLKNHDIIIRHYAIVLLDLSYRRFKALADDGESCYGTTPETAEDAAALFQCLFAVSSGENIANHPKESYIWEARAKIFYMRFSSLINKAMRADNPHGIKDILLPPLDVVEKWPEQVAVLNNNWSAITLDNGSALAVVGDIPINMRIDTGSTGIFLSDEAITMLKQKNEIVSLNTVQQSKGIKSTKDMQEFYVPRFKLGPIKVLNAYVSSSNRAYSLFGISYLRLLQKFTLSSNSIQRMHKSPTSFCSAMRFSHLPVVYAMSSTYLNVPTSLGRLGLMLDSGLTGGGPFANTTVMLKRSFGVKVVRGGVDSGGVSNVSLVIGKFVGGSKEVKFRTAVFGLKINGVPTKGYVGLSLGNGDQVAGSMTRDFLKLFDVSYDYPERTMCLTPRRVGAALASPDGFK